MLIAHHIVITNEGELGDDFFPGYGTPARDAETESPSKTLPVSLWNHAGTAHVMRHHFTILGVHVINSIGELVDKVLHVNSQINQVSGVEIEPKLFATAH